MLEIKDICVIGLGYVGLPTATILANEGFSVLGVDINQDLIEMLKKGKFDFQEPKLEELFSKNINLKKLKISTKASIADAYIICVPTPCTEEKKAELGFLYSAIENISSLIKENDLIVIESTIPINTTENCKKKLLELRSDLEAEKLFFAHCPERVLPGNAIFEIIYNDRVIGGLNNQATLLANSIYCKFSKGNIFSTSAKVAEMVKLSENTFRDVNIALANQLSLIAEESNIDINEVIALANQHPRVNIHRPSIGVGGHCIPIDPYFILENYDNEIGNNLISTARKLNIHIESVTLNKITQYIEKNKSKKIKNIYLYGLTYKANVDDFRESPALRIVAKLGARYLGKEFFAVDPYLNEEYESENLIFKKDLYELNDSILIILVRHSKIEEIIKNKKNYSNLKLLDLS